MMAVSVWDVSCLPEVHQKVNIFNFSISNIHANSLSQDLILTLHICGRINQAEQVWGYRPSTHQYQDLSVLLITACVYVCYGLTSQSLHLLHFTSVTLDALKETHGPLTLWLHCGELCTITPPTCFCHLDGPKVLYWLSGKIKFCITDLCHFKFKK